MHERHDSCPLTEILWRETDLRYYDVGEVWLPSWAHFVIVHCLDGMEQPWEAQRSVRRVEDVVETAAGAGLLCQKEVSRLAVCQPS